MASRKETGEAQQDPNAGEAAAVVEKTGGRNRRTPTAVELAEACGDPVLLLEAVAHLANQDRFRRNNHLMQIAQHYAVEQKALKEVQARLDAKYERKAAELAAVEPAAAEASE